MRAKKRAANAALFKSQKRKNRDISPRFFIARMAGSYTIFPSPRSGGRAGLRPTFAACGVHRPCC